VNKTSHSKAGNAPSTNTLFSVGIHASRQTSGPAHTQPSGIKVIRIDLHPQSLCRAPRQSLDLIRPTSCTCHLICIGLICPLSVVRVHQKLSWQSYGHSALRPSTVRDPSNNALLTVGVYTRQKLPLNAPVVRVHGAGPAHASLKSWALTIGTRRGSFVLGQAVERRVAYN
jgi:hypothetical protein